MSDYTDKLSFVQVVSESVDSFRLEFQGSLTKVTRLPSPAMVLDRDAYDFKKAFSREIAAAVRPHYEDGVLIRAREIPERDVVRSSDGFILGVHLSDGLRKIIDQRSYLRAANSKNGAKRGKIADFSPKSRKRLIEHMARLDRAVKGLFVTITYRENMQDYALAKKHLDKLLRWLKYNHPGYATIWRMEEQERGAIHFHLLVLGAKFIHANTLTEYWQKMTGDMSYPDIKKIKNRKQAMHYAAKYVAKARSANGFISLPNSENSSLDFVPAENPEHFITAADGTVVAAEGKYVDQPCWPGRFWGISNRACLPLADKTEVLFRGRLRALCDLRRAAARFTPHVRRSSSFLGFTVFGAAGGWLRLWKYYDKAYRAAAAPYGYKLVKTAVSIKNISPGYLEMLASGLNIN